MVQLPLGRFSAAAGIAVLFHVADNANAFLCLHMTAYSNMLRRFSFRVQQPALLVPPPLGMDFSSWSC